MTGFRGTVSDDPSAIGEDNKMGKVFHDSVKGRDPLSIAENMPPLRPDHSSPATMGSPAENPPPAKSYEPRILPDEPCRMNGPTPCALLLSPQHRLPCSLHAHPEICTILATSIRSREIPQVPNRKRIAIYNSTLAFPLRWLIDRPSSTIRHRIACKTKRAPQHEFQPKQKAKE